MEFLQYLIIGSAIIFLISLTWLANLTGLFDCLKNSNQVKSPNHCLQIIVEKSDKILQASKQVSKSKNLPYQPKTSPTTEIQTEATNTIKARQLRHIFKKENLTLKVYCKPLIILYFSQQMGWPTFFYSGSSSPVQVHTPWKLTHRLEQLWTH